MKNLLVNLKEMSTQTWMWTSALIMGIGLLSAGMGAYLNLPTSIMVPWGSFVFFVIGIVCIVGAIRQEFFQYKVIRGTTAVVLNILMIIFAWGLAIALLISWLTKR